MQSTRQRAGWSVIRIHRSWALELPPSDVYPEGSDVMSHDDALSHGGWWCSSMFSVRVPLRPVRVTPHPRQGGTGTVREMCSDFCKQGMNIRKHEGA